MAPEPFTANVEIQNTNVLVALTGPQGRVLGEIARQSGAGVNVRGNVILLNGAQGDVEVARRFLEGAAVLVERGVPIGPHDVGRSMRSLREDPAATLGDLLTEIVVVSPKRRPVVPKTPMQRTYVGMIKGHDLTFGIGPAGTGKTYLAMAVAASALVRKAVKRIVLTRPAVEAGEKLGFLPGDLAEKVNPYLRPLYDALHDMLDFDRVEQLRERGQIEVAPLAFMRGRTLNDSFVILDEAQNATSEQMRMFLTRLGYNSKAVVTGDVTQTDLPSGARSGLKEAWQLLTGVEGIAFCEFSEVDVVRHPLVQRIVMAYDGLDRRRSAAASERRGTHSTAEPPSQPPASDDGAAP